MTAFLIVGVSVGVIVLIWGLAQIGLSFLGPLEAGYGEGARNLFRNFRRRRVPVDAPRVPPVSTPHAAGRAPAIPQRRRAVVDHIADWHSREREWLRGRSERIQ